MKELSIRSIICENQEKTVRGRNSRHLAKILEQNRITYLKVYFPGQNGYNPIELKHSEDYSEMAASAIKLLLNKMKKLLEMPTTDFNGWELTVSGNHVAKILPRFSEEGETKANQSQADMERGLSSYYGSKKSGDYTGD